MSETEQPGTPLETIPGIGPIRVRALRKAGYEDLESLRGALVADIAAIRGLTEIKAQYILDFVTQHFGPATKPVTSKSDTPKTKKGKPLGDKPAPTTAPEPEPVAAVPVARVIPKLIPIEPFQPMIAMVQIANEATAVLKSDIELDDELSSQLSKLTGVPSRVKHTLKPDGKRAKAVEKQCVLIHLLLEAIGSVDPNKEKLSKEIRSARRKLLDAIE
ncbi:MAG: helix-hairpin-helix domain-containing protein [Chthonomonadales bacterium]